MKARQRSRIGDDVELMIIAMLGDSPDALRSYEKTLVYAAKISATLDEVIKTVRLNLADLREKSADPSLIYYNAKALLALRYVRRRCPEWWPIMLGDAFVLNCMLNCK